MTLKKFRNPKALDKQIKTFFAWRPITARVDNTENYETRWLEKVTVMYVYRYAFNSLSNSPCWCVEKFVTFQEDKYIPQREV